MNRFGSTPDLRFGMEIIDATDWARATECPLFSIYSPRRRKRATSCSDPETAEARLLLLARRCAARADAHTGGRHGRTAWLILFCAVRFTST